jgi:endogenous inhibitor of DNA gyrase (YacG/DUF329 family)
LPEPVCPICAKPADAKLRPFCSRRCADVDLGRWITGQYVVPGREGEADDPPPLDMRDSVG